MMLTSSSTRTVLFTGVGGLEPPTDRTKTCCHAIRPYPNQHAHAAGTGFEPVALFERQLSKLPLSTTQSSSHQPTQLLSSTSRTIMIYSSVIYYTIQYSTLPHYTIPHSTILYYHSTTLYFSFLCSMGFEPMYNA